MSKINTGAFGVAAVVALSAAIIFPVVFGEPAAFKDRVGGDPWWNFAYNFQTLITGVIAVAAAFLTVRQMRITDDKADIRHEDSRRLIQWATTLKVERLLYPQLDELATTLLKLQWLQSRGLPPLPLDHESSAEFMEKIYETSTPLGRQCQVIDHILRRPPFAEAAELFDGRLRLAIDMLTASNSDVIFRTGQVFEYFNDLRNDAKRRKSGGIVRKRPQSHATSAELNAKLTPAVTAALISCLSEVVEGLRRLAKIYQISL
ncbi:hypothetical protein [Pararhizobium sp.]|uniref:hypothetical protein n=1 Tax=Pararhizobium sp. TaxID=1977563 RepID=UPI003D14FECB